MPLRSSGRVRRSHNYWHLIFFALVLGLLFAALRGLGPVLTPVAAALVLAYLLDPLVERLERRLGAPRWLGTLILFVAAMLLLAGMLLVVVPLLVREIHTFAESMPRYMATIKTTLVPWVEATFSVTVPNSLEALADQFGADLRQLASQAVKPLGGVAGKVAERAGAMISALGTLMLIPVFTFYFLPQFPGILSGAEDLIPRRYLSTVRATAGEVDQVLSAWIRGQLMVIMVQAVLYSVGLSIAGLKLAVLIGLLTASLAFIPYVGVVIGLSLAMLLSLLDYSGPGQLIGVAAVFAAVQVLDGFAITPFLVGEKVGLGAVGVLLALMLGGHLFGFVGILLAVPVAAATAVVIRRALSTYKESLYYQKGSTRPRDPAPAPEPEPGPGPAGEGLAPSCDEAETEEPTDPEPESEETP